jgi:hypothetical protein
LRYHGNLFLQNRKILMQDSYSLSPRQARVCRIAAALFLLAGLLRIMAALVPLATASPGLEVHCAGGSCQAAGRPELLLPEPLRAQVSTSPAAAVRLAAYAGQQAVRAGLVGADLAEAIPFALLMLCVAGALGRLGARGADALARALPWLRRASFAALGTAFAPPLADSARAMLLLPATPAGPSWYFALDLGSFLLGLLLALAAFAVSWALAAGSRAEQDMAEFV